MDTVINLDMYSHIKFCHFKAKTRKTFQSKTTGLGAKLTLNPKSKFLVH